MLVNDPLYDPVPAVGDRRDQTESFYALKFFFFTFVGPFKDIGISAYPACQLSGQENNALGRFDTFARNGALNVILFFCQVHCSEKVIRCSGWRLYHAIDKRSITYEGMTIFFTFYEFVNVRLHLLLLANAFFSLRTEGHVC